VAAGDGERRRLERDLHDGAQQRLVALGLSLRLLRSQLARNGDSETIRRLDLADSELTRATSELRELAQGIFPAVLADGGLSVAVHALAEDSRVPMRIGAMPEARFPAPVETAAYSVVAEAARSGTNTLTVSGEQQAGKLALEVETEHLGALDVGALQDRLGAVDGHLEIDHGENGRVTIRAELPCAS
jgi:signal transduction histidine kinase